MPTLERNLIKALNLTKPTKSIQTKIEGIEKSQSLNHRLPSSFERAIRGYLDWISVLGAFEGPFGPLKQAHGQGQDAINLLNRIETSLTNISAAYDPTATAADDATLGQAVDDFSELVKGFAVLFPGARLRPFYAANETDSSQSPQAPKTNSKLREPPRSQTLPVKPYGHVFQDVDVGPRMKAFLGNFHDSSQTPEQIQRSATLTFGNIRGGEDAFMHLGDAYGTHPFAPPKEKKKNNWFKKSKE